MVGRVTVVYVVIVAVNGIEVASFVNAHIHKLMPVANRGVRVVVHNVIGEGLTAIGRDSHVDNVVTAGSSRAACDLASIRNTTEGLINDVVIRIDGKIPGRIVLGKERMIRIKSLAQLSERQTGIVTAVHINVEGRDVMIGDTHLGGSIGGNPFAVITGNSGTGWVEGPGLAIIHAGTNINVGQAETGNIHIIITASVSGRGHSQVSITSTGSETTIVAS